MHLWCFCVGMLKLLGIGHVVLSWSLLQKQRSMQIHTHKDTHTHKKKQVLLVVVLWFHPLAAFPKCETQLIAQLLFFCTLPVPSLFFCNVSVTLHFFLHFARSIPSFFNTLPVTSFFLHFVCHIAFFFAIWWLLRIFFCNPLSQLHFFWTGRLAIPALHFFCKTYLHH